MWKKEFEWFFEEGTPDGVNNFKYEFITYVRK